MKKSFIAFIIVCAFGSLQADEPKNERILGHDFDLSQLREYEEVELTLAEEQALLTAFSYSKSKS